MPKSTGPSFSVSQAEANIIHKIARRAVAQLQVLSVHGCTVLDVHMDIIACHANGCPLRLEDLLAADPFNFAHDVLGIARHLNRTTGQVEGFSPRFRARTPRKAA
ncbi:MAG: hypothetical protein HXY30_16020 [Pseudorhodoplanes sp.]|nr:hypothetical protein [Pseudorhodoplanes sp.]